MTLRVVYLQSVETTYFVSFRVKEWISWQQQTKINNVTKTLSTGYDVTKTRTPCVLAAIQTWYWRINISR